MFLFINKFFIWSSNNIFFNSKWFFEFNKLVVVFTLSYELLSFCEQHLIKYPASWILNFMWSFGFLALIMLVCQLISGLALSTHYVQSTELAFASIEHIIWEVHYGWFLWYSHMFGASVFFLSVYSHIFRGLILWSYSYPWQTLWISGCFIFVLLMGIAFLGYSLPWGQMSFWGVTVITSLVTVVPLFGSNLVMWIWGDFVVAGTTLKWFFILHFLLPFILIILVGWHILELHKLGSWSPYYNSNITSIVSYSSLGTLYIIKDIRITLSIGILSFYFLNISPDIVTHTINSEPANALDTPEHIVPEWYFLPYYAVLWSILSKTLGFMGMVSLLLSIFFLSILSFADACNLTIVIKSQINKYDLVYNYMLILSFLVLGILGAASPLGCFMFVVKLIYFYLMVSIISFNILV